MKLSVNSSFSLRKPVYGKESFTLQQFYSTTTQRTKNKNTVLYLEDSKTIKILFTTRVFKLISIC